MSNWFLPGYKIMSSHLRLHRQENTCLPKVSSFTGSSSCMIMLTEILSCLLSTVLKCWKKYYLPFHFRLKYIKMMAEWWILSILCTLPKHNCFSLMSGILGHILSSSFKLESLAILNNINKALLLADIILRKRCQYIIIFFGNNVENLNIVVGYA